MKYTQEQVREALMRLSMCACKECEICKYKDRPKAMLPSDECKERSKKNVNILADVCLRDDYLTEKGGGEIMFLYNPIGKTLAEIHKDCGGNMGGYSVFVLQDENDTTGKPLDEDFSIGLILKKHPQYANCKVKYENDFYGTTVLRVEKGGEGDG